MGASESTGRLTGTEKEEEEQQRRRQQESGGRFTEAATAVTIVAGAAAAAWGISKLLSSNTDSDENDHDDMAMKADHHGIMERSLPNPSIRPGSGFPPPPDRFRITTSDGGFHSTKAQSSRYIYEGISREQPSMWLPPPRGRYKMNTDGACKPNPGGPIGYGGILRNDHGDFVFCFYEFIGDKTDCVRAELHGIHKGLKLLERFHLKGSILETDSQAAFDWINEPKRGPGRSKVICDCWNMITECIELVSRNKIDLKQIDREDANRCADKLAAMAIKKKENYTETKYVPLEIKDLVDKDKRQIGLLGCG